MVTIQLWLRSYPCTDSYCQRLYWIRHHTRPISLVNTYRRHWACEPHKKYRNGCHACARGREREGESGRERRLLLGICCGVIPTSVRCETAFHPQCCRAHQSRRTDVHKHVQDYGMVTGPATPRIAPNSKPTSTPSCVNGLGLLGFGACAG